MRTNSVSKEIQNDKEIKVYKYTTKVINKLRQGHVGISGWRITSLMALINYQVLPERKRGDPTIGPKWFSSLGTTR